MGLVMGLEPNLADDVVVRPAADQPRLLALGAGVAPGPAAGVAASAAGPPGSAPTLARPSAPGDHRPGRQQSAGLPRPRDHSGDDGADGAVGPAGRHPAVRTDRLQGKTVRTPDRRDGPVDPRRGRDRRLCGVDAFHVLDRAGLRGRRDDRPGPLCQPAAASTGHPCDQLSLRHDHTGRCGDGAAATALGRSASASPPPGPGGRRFRRCGTVHRGLLPVQPRGRTARGGARVDLLLPDAGVRPDTRPATATLPASARVGTMRRSTPLRNRSRRRSAKPSSGAAVRPGSARPCPEPKRPSPWPPD